MRQRWQFIGFASVLILSLAFAPGEILGQKKEKKAPKKDDGYPATPADYTQIQNVKELTGSLITIDGSSHTLTLRVEIPHSEPNPNYKPTVPKMGPGVTQQAYAAAKYQFDQWKLYQDLLKQQQAAMQAKTLQERQRAMQKVQQDMVKWQMQQALYSMKMSAAYAKGLPKVDTNPNNQPFKVVTVLKDYALEIQDDIVVRKNFLGTEFDDTGNIKKYTDKEKEEMRGKDKTKPGYQAKFEDLLPGQEVKLYLTSPKKKKDAKVDKADKADKADKTEKTDEDGVSNIDRPTVNMILMTTEMTVSSIGDNAKKGKK